MISEGKTVVYAKLLEDGSITVGLSNLGEYPEKVGFTTRTLGMWGDKTIRDVWRQQDIVVYKENQRYEASVNPHGVQLLRIYPGNSHTRAVRGR